MALLLIDVVWLLAAIGLLVWGSILLFRGHRWKRGIICVSGGALLMAARYMDAVWRMIHACLDS